MGFAHCSRASIEALLCGLLVGLISAFGMAGELETDDRGQAQELARIDEAWQEFLSQLEGSGKLIREQAHSRSITNRFEGYRAALAIASVGYANLLFPDADSPEYIPDFGPLVNYCAPAPDFKYGIFHLDPEGTYRVRGYRGDAEFIDLQQQIGWYGKRVGANQIVTKLNTTFAEIDSGIDSDGYYEFILSAKEHSGHWWKLEEGVDALFIREFYVDFNTKPRTATFFIDRIDTPPSTSTAVSDVDEAVFRLRSLSRMQDYLNLCLRMGSAFPEGDNEIREERYDQGAGQLDQRYFQARYSVAADEALIVSWPVPEHCRFWSFALYNDYWQVLNYGSRQTHLNKSMVDVGDDDIARIVISHSDPGLQNWIDVDGHNTGILLGRAKICEAATLPRLEKVKLKDLERSLPKNVKRVSSDERRAQLATRREHYLYRYSR